MQKYIYFCPVCINLRRSARHAYSLIVAKELWYCINALQKREDKRCNYWSGDNVVIRLRHVDEAVVRHYLNSEERDKQPADYVPGTDLMQ